jgi:Cu+-exporting ATPase
MLADAPHLATMRKTKDFSEFLQTYESPSSADRFCRFFVPVVIILSVAGAVISGAIWVSSGGTVNKESYPLFLSVFSMCIASCACIALPLASAVPLYATVSDLAGKRQGAILGHKAIDEFHGINTAMLDAEHFFPPESITLHAIKPQKDFAYNDAVIYASSLAYAAGSIFAEVLDGIVLTNIPSNMSNTLSRIPNDKRDSSRLEVKDLEVMYGQGVSGTIANRRVLFGSRTFMNMHKIAAVLTTEKENMFTSGRLYDALYLSVSGTLAAVYVFELLPKNEIKQWLDNLASENVAIAVRSIDPVVTVNKIGRLFELPEGMVKIIPPSSQDIYKSETIPLKRMSATAVTSGSLTAFSRTVSAIKTVKSVITGCNIIQAVASAIFLAIVLFFVFTGTQRNVTASMLLIFNAVAMVVTLATIKLKR